ncbi:MAG: aldo/keto reductase [SAR86 cluster bacterium]|uniref:Aldo/keto reductase n=1 Tax=SAR86 cluster bacterium TaxID=2030880 RepID=A0A2A4MFJ1_9GAMM|nr:MAG: aldo/keto reductase [SAR86 cluster bacterium]
MQTRKLGELEVSAIGLGCMSMSQSYGKADRKESERTLNLALELGYNFLDTASLYGQGHNESLIGEVLGSKRQQFILASKCGIINIDGKRSVDGTPANIKKTCEESLRRLQTETIDLYYLHRRDFDVPIEESVGALADLKQAGKIRYLGLSECSSETIIKAHREHPICAVQSEYSLWTRDPEYKVLDCCSRLGIGFVPFSPLGRAFLSGKIDDMSKLEDDDMRQTMPRFMAENFKENLILVSQLTEIAKRNHCTSAQLALAWLMQQDENFVAIPGTKHCHYLEENAEATELVIEPADLEIAGELFSAGKVKGDRYAKSQMISLDSDS